VVERAEGKLARLMRRDAVRPGHRQQFDEDAGKLDDPVFGTPNARINIDRADGEPSPR
jgi:hypothetical protein